MGVGRFSYMVPNSVGGDHVDNEPRSVSMPPMGSDGERGYFYLFINFQYF